MTVRELIEALQEMPQDLPVGILRLSDDPDDWDVIEHVLPKFVQVVNIWLDNGASMRFYPRGEDGAQPVIGKAVKI
jgi:hypothetical protein